MKIIEQLTDEYPWTFVVRFTCPTEELARLVAGYLAEQWQRAGWSVDIGSVTKTRDGSYFTGVGIRR